MDITTKTVASKTVFPVRPRALNSRIPGMQGKKREFRTFSYLDVGGEKVFVPLGFLLMSKKLLAAAEGMETTGFTHPGPFPSTHHPSTPGMPVDAMGAREAAPGTWLSIPERFSCSSPCLSSPRGQVQTGHTDMHTLATGRARHTNTCMSLCTHAPGALGPAAARASHFLLHVVVELEFGLVGQLHGSVLQLPAGRGNHVRF